MRHILEVLNKVNPNETSNDYSLVCMATSNQVYLVFSSAKEHPIFAVHKLSTDSMDIDFENLVSIYDLVGNLIPKPIKSVSHLGNDYIIQEGARGKPWFRITEKYDSEERWNLLKAKILDTLQKFQGRLKNREDYIISVDLEKELDAYFDEFKKTNNIDDSMNVVIELYNHVRNHFSTLYDTSISAQHGDFTLNNLLIHDQGITIIDFEDFNIFKVPFYDNFSMALSLALHAPKGIDSDLKKEIQSFTKETKYSKQTMQGFFFMSLIAQLGFWSLSEKRVNHRSWLKGILKDFSSNPEKYIS